MSIIEQKKVIRSEMRQRRQSLKSHQLHEAAEGLQQQLSRLLSADDYPVALYLSFDSELNTQSFIDHAWQPRDVLHKPTKRQFPPRLPRGP